MTYKKKLKNQTSFNNEIINKQTKNIYKNENNQNDFQSKYIDIFNQSIEDVPIRSCISCERLFFLKQLHLIMKRLRKKLSNHVRIEETMTWNYLFVQIV